MRIFNTVNLEGFTGKEAEVANLAFKFKYSVQKLLFSQFRLLSTPTKIEDMEHLMTTITMGMGC